jgi:Ca2+-transporting ATPase
MMIPKTTKGLLDSPHGHVAADVLAALEVSVITGLSEHEAGRRLQHYGPNTIGGRQRVGVLAILIHQFQSLVVALLAVAAGLAFYFGEWEEGGAIVGVLMINALIGFVTEIKAVRSIEALRVLGTRSARVCRDGRTRPISAERLVPGDIVLLDAGDVITADLKLVEASNLEVDESTLTGESVGVSKAIAPVDVNARVSDRSSMLFKGTSITRGSGIGVVVATGMDTELGHISRLVEEAKPETSPLEKKLMRLSGQLVWVTLILTALIGGVGLAQGKELALLRAGRLAGLERGELLDKSPEIIEHAFDTTTKMMATVHHNDGAYSFAIKGAPEAVLAKTECIAGQDSDAVMDEAMRAEWLARVDKLGADGLRVLAFAAHENQLRMVRLSNL